MTSRGARTAGEGRAARLRSWARSAPRILTPLGRGVLVLGVVVLVVAVWLNWHEFVQLGVVAFALLIVALLWQVLPGTPTADLDLTLRGVAFSAMGTCGQRCTTLRRLLVHESVYDKLVPNLKAAYASVSIGDPRESSTLVGPLIDKAAFDGMQKALEAARAAGGKVQGGERVAMGGEDAYYVRPAIVEMDEQDWGGQVTMRATVEREGGDKPVCVAETVFRYYT